jgi:hypothetical protein
LVNYTCTRWTWNLQPHPHTVLRGEGRVIWTINHWHKIIKLTVIFLRWNFSTTIISLILNKLSGNQLNPILPISNILGSLFQLLHIQGHFMGLNYPGPLVLSHFLIMPSCNYILGKFICYIFENIWQTERNCSNGSICQNNECTKKGEILFTHPRITWHLKVISKKSNYLVCTNYQSSLTNSILKSLRYAIHGLYWWKNKKCKIIIDL